MTKSTNNEINGKENEVDLNTMQKSEDSEILSKVQAILQRFEEDKKLKKIISDFDKHTEDFSFEDMLTNNLQMVEIIEKAKKERDEYLSLLQRFKADFENYKKRSEKQAQHGIQLSTERIISKIFEPIEDINRAIKFAKDKSQETIPLEGIEIIYNKLARVLEDEDIIEINPIQGEIFDPKYHEAICLDHSNNFKSDIVVQVFEKGYKIKDRVLRAAKVMVSAEAIDNEISKENEKEKTENKEY